MMRARASRQEHPMSSRTFTKDETYVLECQYRYGSTGDDHYRRHVLTYLKGTTLTHGELSTAYSLGAAAGDPPIPALFGDGADASRLPSPEVHTVLGYAVSSDWRKRAQAIVDLDGADAADALAWLGRVAEADATLGM